jgi:hypothetical protein
MDVSCEIIFKYLIITDYPQAEGRAARGQAGRFLMTYPPPRAQVGLSPSKQTT